MYPSIKTSMGQIDLNLVLINSSISNICIKIDLAMVDMP